MEAIIAEIIEESNAGHPIGVIYTPVTGPGAPIYVRLLPSTMSAHDGTLAAHPEANIMQAEYCLN